MCSSHSKPFTDIVPLSSPNRCWSGQQHQLSFILKKPRASAAEPSQGYTTGRWSQGLGLVPLGLKESLWRLFQRRTLHCTNKFSVVWGDWRNSKSQNHQSIEVTQKYFSKVAPNHKTKNSSNLSGAKVEIQDRQITASLPGGSRLFLFWNFIIANTTFSYHQGCLCPLSSFKLPVLSMHQTKFLIIYCRFWFVCFPCVLVFVISTRFSIPWE